MSRTGLSIGVTGHRNFSSSDPRLSGIVLGAMKSTIREFQPKDAGPGTVVSAFAEGADRLVARLGREHLRFNLLALLPMPVDSYMMDFGTDESKAEFNALLAIATSVIEAPLLSEGDALKQYTEERNHQYAWVGAFIARRAHVLFALWDGEPARGTGGTAHVVGWFLDGRVPRKYRISLAPRLPTSLESPRELIHVNPHSHRVRRRVLEPSAHTG